MLSTSVRIILSIITALIFCAIIALVVYLIFFKSSVKKQTFDCSTCNNCDGKCIDCPLCEKEELFCESQTPEPGTFSLKRDMTTGKMFWVKHSTNEKGWYCKNGEQIMFDPNNPEYQLPWSSTVSEDNDNYYSFWKTVFFLFIHPNREEYIKQVLSAKENVDSSFCKDQREKTINIFTESVCGIDDTPPSPKDVDESDAEISDSVNVSIPSDALISEATSSSPTGFKSVVDGNCVDSVCAKLFPDNITEPTDFCDNAWGSVLCKTLGDNDQCKERLSTVISSTFDQEGGKQSIAGSIISADVLSNALNSYLDDSCHKLYKSVDKYYNEILAYISTKVNELQTEGKLIDIIKMIINFGILIKTKEELQQIIDKLIGPGKINVGDLIEQFELPIADSSITTDGPKLESTVNTNKIDTYLEMFSKYYLWYSTNVLGVNSFQVKTRIANSVRNFLLEFIIDYDATCNPKDKSSPCRNTGQCTIGGRGQFCPPDLPTQIARLSSSSEYPTKCKDGLVNMFGGREIVCGPKWDRKILDGDIKLNFDNLLKICKYSGNIIKIKESIDTLISMKDKAKKGFDWVDTNIEMIESGLESITGRKEIGGLEFSKASDIIEETKKLKEEIPSFFKSLIDDIPFPAKQILQVLYKGISIGLDHFPPKTIYDISVEISQICDDVKSKIKEIQLTNAKQRNRQNTILFMENPDIKHSIKLSPKPENLSDIANTIDIYWSFEQNDVFYIEEGQTYPGFPSYFDGYDIDKYREWIITNGQKLGIDPCTCSKSSLIGGYDHGLPGGCSESPVYDSINLKGQVVKYNTSIFDTDTLKHHQPICAVSDLCPSQMPLSEDKNNVPIYNRKNWPQPYYLSKKSLLDQHIDMGYLNPKKNIIGTGRTIPRWRYCNRDLDNTGNLFFQALKLLEPEFEREDMKNRKSSIYNIVLRRKNNNTESYKIFIEIYTKISNCESTGSCSEILSDLENKFTIMEKWLTDNNLMNKIYSDTYLTEENSLSTQSGFTQNASDDTSLYVGWHPVIDDKSQSKYFDYQLNNKSKFVDYMNEDISEGSQMLNKKELAAVLAEIKDNDILHNENNINKNTFTKNITSRKYPHVWGLNEGWDKAIVTPFDTVYCSKDTCHRDKIVGDGSGGSRGRNNEDFGDNFFDFWGLRNQILPCPTGYKDSGDIHTDEGWKRVCKWDKINGLHDYVICGKETEDGYPICQGFGGKNFVDYGEKYDTTGSNALWWSGSWDSNDLVKCEDITLPGDKNLTGVYVPDQSHYNVQDKDHDKYLSEGINENGYWDPSILTSSDDLESDLNELGTFYKRDSWLPGNIRGVDRVKLRKCKLLKRKDGKTVSKWNTETRKWID